MGDKFLALLFAFGIVCMCIVCFFALHGFMEYMDREEIRVLEITKHEDFYSLKIYKDGYIRDEKLKTKEAVDMYINIIENE